MVAKAKKPKATKVATGYGTPKRVTLKDGPWDGLAINTRVGHKDATLVVRVGSFHGCYRMNHNERRGVWEDVQVN